jgi:hypothetical protein
MSAATGKNLSCPNHPDRIGEKVCKGCGKAFCRECLADDLCSRCIALAAAGEVAGYVEEKKDIREFKGATKEKRLLSKPTMILAAVLVVLILLEMGLVVAQVLTNSQKVEHAEYKERRPIAMRNGCLLNLGGLAQAVDRHKSRHGAYPQDLGQLTGLPENMDICPATDLNYTYELTDTGYRISCADPRVHGLKRLYITEDGLHFVGGGDEDEE